MPTPIKVNDSTKRMLEKVKTLENRATFDAVITELAEERLAVPKSFFGKGKGRITKFKRSDRLKTHFED